MNPFHRWFCRSSFWKKALSAKILPWALAGVELGHDVLEIGPGPGLTTDILRQQVMRVTSVEIDHRLANSLKRRLDGTNVTVVEGDATALPFKGSTFSGAVSFTMLHHVPSPALQNRLLSEVYSVLKPGGMLVGSDSIWSRGLQLAHFGDTLVVVDPDTFGVRLAAAGFTDVSVDRARRTFRFRARRP